MDEKDKERLVEIYSRVSSDEKTEELIRLGKLFHQRQTEFKKASRLRWILTFVGFAVVFL